MQLDLISAILLEKLWWWYQWFCRKNKKEI